MRSLRTARARHTVLTLLSVALASSAIPTHAANWNEAIDGDLSNNRLSPSDWTLTAGSNSLTATMPGSDLDYVTTIIPAGHELSALTLVSYASTDGTAFIGVQAGDQVTATQINAAPLLGYTHFGTGPGNVGQNILPAMGTGAGAMGFTPPLPAGNYSFWIQQASGANVSYQFNFQVTALPIADPPGDYNDDNIVDAADYTVWQDNLGSTTALPNDATPTIVDNDDFDAWKANFGEVAMGAGNVATAVPECATLVLMAIAAPWLATTPRRRAW